MKQLLSHVVKFRFLFVLFGVVGLLFVAGSLSVKGATGLFYSSPDSINEGAGEVTFSTYSTYASYKWWISDGPGYQCDLLGTTPVETETFTRNMNQSGDWQVCLRVPDTSDPSGYTTDSQTVTVNNLPPTIDDPSWWTISAEPSVVGVPFHVEVPFTDFEDTGFACSIDYGDGIGELDGTITHINNIWKCVGPDHTYTTAGQFTVQATVYDVVGEFPSYSTSDYYYHTVAENQAPVALDYFAAYGTWPSTEPFDSVFEVPAIDPEGNPLTISYIEVLDPATEGIVGNNAYYYCDYMDKCWVTFYIIPPTGVTPGGSMNITFQYRVNDGTSDSNTATITLSFGYNIPYAYESHQLAAKNATTTIRLEGGGSAPLTFLTVRNPEHGSVGLPAGTTCEQWVEDESVGYICNAAVDYTPVTDFEGEDSFAFVVSNGSAYSRQQEVRLWVAPNSAPTATAGTATVSAVQPSTITLEASDPDWIMATPEFWNMHDDLTFVIDTNPSNGTLGTPSESYCEGILIVGLDYDAHCRSMVLYTPDSGTTATADSFTFHVNDSHLSSSPVTFSLTLRYPTTLHVNAADDVVDASGCDESHCSLREAVNAATSGDSIDFTLPSLPATITLVNGQILINKNITITGPGADQLAISGGALPADPVDGTHSRVFEFDNGGQPMNASLSGVTIKDGRTGEGGGIRNGNKSSLEMSDCVIGPNNVVTNAGGGIVNSYGILTLNRCTVVGNHGTGAIGGAGIFAANGGSITLINSTVTENVTNNYGGGILAWYGGTVNLVHSTVSGNLANQNYLTEAWGGGGGIYIDHGTVNIQNSIVAGNTDLTNPATAAHPKYPDVYGTFTSLGGNLVGDDTGSTGWGATDVVGNATEPIDAMLEPLALNDPGTTPTFALLEGSPAIDAADCLTEVTIDQRGVTRPQGSSCDIGAFELEQTVLDTTPPVVTVPSDMTVAATSSSGAVVTFVATAIDDVDGTLTPVCVPASGSTFVVGTTTVSCSATDAALNMGSASFTVTVSDQTNPVVTVPEDVTYAALGPEGVSVYFTATALDDVDGVLTPICVPASDSIFPVGTTTVTCTAIDAALNEGSNNFTVTVVQSMYVSAINLTNKAGRTNTITGLVTIRNYLGALLSKAAVTIEWHLPSGIGFTKTVSTDRNGVAKFVLRGMPAGTYELWVINVTKSDWIFVHDTAYEWREITVP